MRENRGQNRGRCPVIHQDGSFNSSKPPNIDAFFSSFSEARGFERASVQGHLKRARETHEIDPDLSSKMQRSIWSILALEDLATRFEAWSDGYRFPHKMAKLICPDSMPTTKIHGAVILVDILRDANKDSYDLSGFTLQNFSPEEEKAELRGGRYDCHYAYLDQIKSHDAGLLLYHLLQWELEMVQLVKSSPDEAWIYRNLLLVNYEEKEVCDALRRDPPMLLGSKILNSGLSFGIGYIWDLLCDSCAMLDFLTDEKWDREKWLEHNAGTESFLKYIAKQHVEPLHVLDNFMGGTRLDGSAVTWHPTFLNPKLAISKVDADARFSDALIKRGQDKRQVARDTRSIDSDYRSHEIIGCPVVFSIAFKLFFGHVVTAASELYVPWHKKNLPVI